MLTAASIKAKARLIGFDACGIAPASGHPELDVFKSWIGRGYAASMAYLERSAADRSDVRRILTSARTVVATATLYNTDRPYSTESADRSRAEIARHAWGEDYHRVIGDRLEALLAWMRESSPDQFDAKIYVDTGPVQERVYARHAGIGWIAKNTCVINPELGSWILLGEIICSLPLDVDEPSFDQCGTCTLCLEACPTGALVGAGVLDSARCISYLTIEHRGAIDAALSSQMGNHVYGCDVCQEVCPWNGAAPVSRDPVWQPRAIWRDAALEDLRTRTDAELTAGLRGSAMKRAKVAGLRRNLGIAAENAKASTSEVGR